VTHINRCCFGINWKTCTRDRFTVKTCSDIRMCIMIDQLHKILTLSYVGEAYNIIKSVSLRIMYLCSSPAFARCRRSRGTRPHNTLCSQGSRYNIVQLYALATVYSTMFIQGYTLGICLCIVHFSLPLTEYKSLDKWIRYYRQRLGYHGKSTILCYSKQWQLHFADRRKKLYSGLNIWYIAMYITGQFAVDKIKIAW